MSVTDEEIIRKRLLVDGDGTGDDRRINILLRKFMKWCNSDEDPVDWKASRDQLLSLLSQCEYAYLKSRLTASMTTSELENYANISQQIDDEIARVKEEISGTKEDFKEAKIVRKNRLEYEVLKKVIQEQPDRKQTNSKLISLKTEYKNLQEKNEQLERKLEMRRKQFHVLFASLQQLQALLDDDEDENMVDVSLTGSEEEDDLQLIDSTPEKMDVA